MIGQTFSHYRILEKLGEGGMGVVYKAEDTKLKRLVALKFLPMSAAEDSEEKARFIREAQAAAALDHPNIATVYEINETEEKPFIAMTFVDGVTLKEKIRSGALTVDDAIDVAIQIAQGLGEAHDKGIIHRDVKSSNIMITPNGQVKITDFGLAKFKGGKTLTKPGTQIGTASFMSPEQIQGKPVTHQSDIFSLGVVFYELLTGDLPFKGENDQAVMYSILYDTPPSIAERQPKVSPELEQIVAKALEKDVKERYQNSDEILEDLLELRRNRSAGKADYISKPMVKKKKRSAKAKIPLLKRPYIYGAVAVLLILLCYAGLKIFSGHGITIDSIAVLPFENLSEDPEQNYFVDGMNEELITVLSKIGSIKLIQPKSVIRYKGSSKLTPQISRELNVDALIRGSVLRVDNQVRISVQIINGNTSEYIWAGSYDRDLRNILVLLSEVARDIADEIKVVLVPKEKERLAGSRPVNPEAYEAYLKGWYFLRRLTVENFQKSLKCFQEAVDIDSGFAPAWAGLGGANVMLGYFGNIPPHETIPQAKKAALKALELDDQDAWAYTVLGWAQLFDWDWQGAKKTFQKALELNPNDPDALHGYGDILTVTGRLEDGLVFVKRGRECDPFSAMAAIPVASHLYMMHRYDESIEEAQKLLQPGFEYPARLVLSMVFWQKGMYEEALAEHRKVLPPQRLDALERGYMDSGPKGAMLALARRMVEESKLKYVDPLEIAYRYARTDEIDLTFEYLEKACEQRSTSLFYIKVRPEFDHLRSYPRFQNILDRIGLIAFEQKIKK